MLMEAIVERAKRSGSDPVAEAAVRTLPDLGVGRDRMVADRLRYLVPARPPPRGAPGRVPAGRDGPPPARARRGGQAPRRPEDRRHHRSSTLTPTAGSATGPRRSCPSAPRWAAVALPSFDDLIRRDGDATHGREVFYTVGETACASCHRVQGRGRWVGPDLSTIGTKYGKDGLLTSILSPSDAIGYNFRSYVVALADGRILTGLPVEETADRLVLKTAEGERLDIDPADIEEKRTSDVSLMPEGLAQQMERPAARRPARLPLDPEAAGQHRRRVPGRRPARRGRRRAGPRPDGRRSTPAPRSAAPTAASSPGDASAPTPRDASTSPPSPAATPRRPSTCTPRSSPRATSRRRWSSTPPPAASGPGSTASRSSCRRPPARRARPARSPSTSSAAPMTSSSASPAAPTRPSSPPSSPTSRSSSDPRRARSSRAADRRDGPRRPHPGAGPDRPPTSHQ